MDIFDDVIHYFGCGDTRKVLATQTTEGVWDASLPDIDTDTDSDSELSDCNERPNLSIHPELALSGEDPRLLPRSVYSYTQSMSVDVEGRRALYRGCVARKGPGSTEQAPY